MTSRFIILTLFLVSCTGASPTHRNPAADDFATSRASESATEPATTTTTTPATIKPAGAELQIMSWNMKHLGRRNENTQAAAGLLKDADLITLQEVNSTNTGQDAIMRLATQLRTFAPDDRICVGLSELGTDAKERYGYLWKDSRVAYVKTNGEAMDRCPQGAVTIRVEKSHADQIVREPAVGTFRARVAARDFTLVSIHLVPSGKKPQLEVPPLFESVKDIEGPIVVAGDYNLDSGHSAFGIWRESGFAAAFLGKKSSLKSKKRELNKAYDNFWFRDISLSNAEIINTYEKLADIPQAEIYNSVSDHCPIKATIAFDTDVREPNSVQAFPLPRKRAKTR